MNHSNHINNASFHSNMSSYRLDSGDLDTSTLNRQEQKLLEGTVIDENGWYHIPGGTMVSPRGVIFDPDGNVVATKKGASNSIRRNSPRKSTVGGATKMDEHYAATTNDLQGGTAGNEHRQSSKKTERGPKGDSSSTCVHPLSNRTFNGERSPRPPRSKRYQEESTGTEGEEEEQEKPAKKKNRSGRDKKLSSSRHHRSTNHYDGAERL